MPKKLHRLVFLRDGKWVKAKDQSKAVTPKPIGYPFSRYSPYESGPNKKELESIVRSCIKSGERLSKEYGKVNAYVACFGDRLGVPNGDVKIQLYKIRTR